MIYRRIILLVERLFSPESHFIFKQPIVSFRTSNFWERIIRNLPNCYAFKKRSCFFFVYHSDIKLSIKQSSKILFISIWYLLFCTNLRKMINWCFIFLLIWIVRIENNGMLSKLREKKKWSSERLLNLFISLNL